MGRAGYIFMGVGAGLIAIPLYYAWLILTGQMNPLVFFQREPGIIDLSALWNLLLNFIILLIMVKVGSALLQHGANSTKSET